MCKSFLDATKEAVKLTQIEHFPNLKEGSHEKASNDNLSKHEDDGNYMKKGTNNSSTCLVIFLLILFAVVIIIVATIYFLKRKKTNHVYVPRYFG